MADLIQHPAVQALAWALVHFVWQGALIALAAYVALRAVPSSASARYTIGVCALALMIAAPVATFVNLVSQQTASTAGIADPSSSQAGPAAGALELAVSTQPGAELTMAGTSAAMILAAAVGVWIAGVLFFSIRLLGGWVVARRVARRAVAPVSAHIQDLARQLAARLRVTRVVSVVQSGAVVVPVMVGWLRPTVILPVAALAGLSPTQLEALLAHELAHVRRHDYLINLLQSVAEALLFYHPAVWWLSARVRAERELCCDDLAVGVCDRLAYATALSELAAMASPRVALAATDGDLLHRVKRILEQGGDMSTRRVSGIPLLILVLVAGIAAPAALAATHTRSSAIDQRAVTIEQAATTQDIPSARVATERATAEIYEASPEQSQAQQQADDKRLLELRRTLEDIQKQLTQIEMQRADTVKRADETRSRASNQTEAASKMNEAASRLQQMARENESQASRKHLDEMQSLFEKGVVSEQQLKEAQAAVARTRALGNRDEMMKLDVEKLQQQVVRSQTLADKGVISQRDVAAQQDALKQAIRQLSESAVRLKEVQPEAQLKALADRQMLAERLSQQTREAVARDPQRQAEENSRRLMDLQKTVDQRRSDPQVNEPFRMLANRATDVNQNEAVRPGDVLRITIEGEPDLPSSYQVREDGTIRMPFLGSIKVAGMPAANVRAVVGKQLSERKLGSASQVGVVLLRGRAR